MGTDYEKLGAFYLGRVFDPGQNRVSAEPLLYDSRDLTTHAVCVGMTGSGKTGLCLALLEEAAIDGIPAICIDPKGDLNRECEAAVAALDSRLDAQAMALRAVSLAPRKTDIAVGKVLLLWTPWRTGADGFPISAA